MLLIRQNYKFESYLQPLTASSLRTAWCCWYVKITNLKAIYNLYYEIQNNSEDVVDTSKLQIWKLFTTNKQDNQRRGVMLLIRQNYKFESYLQLRLTFSEPRNRCCWYVKITNLKAIYNKDTFTFASFNDVVDTSKLQIWKLFTTFYPAWANRMLMLLIRQNYKFESYLQLLLRQLRYNFDVVDTSKLQIWKLFTTIF